MSKNAILTLVTETPLHPGIGQNVGVIDLPVRRERHTRFPYVPSSSLKGSLRSAMEIDDEMKNALFGSELGSSSQHAGAMSFSDTRILAFPVRTLNGIFAWVTSPIIIDRLRRDLDLLGLEFAVDIPARIDSSKILSTSTYKGPTRIVIEDLMLEVTKNPEVDRLANVFASICLGRNSHKVLRTKLQQDLFVLSEPHFQHLVEFGTEVLARNQLDLDTKTSNNLWSIELIPRDTLFYSILIAEDSRSGQGQTAEILLQELTSKLSGKHVQLGGNETLGHGWCASTILTIDSLKGILDA